MSYKDRLRPNAGRLNPQRILRPTKQKHSKNLI